MAYQIQDLDPVKELSPTRKGIEFGVVFVIVFLAARFGGWHHDMDPLDYTVHPPTWVALLIAAGTSALYVLWRSWYSSHTAVPRQ